VRAVPPPYYFFPAPMNAVQFRRASPSATKFLFMACMSACFGYFLEAFFPRRNPPVLRTRYHTGVSFLLTVSVSLETGPVGHPLWSAILAVVGRRRPYFVSSCPVTNFDPNRSHFALSINLAEESSDLVHR